MAYNAHKTEHCGPKKGCGAYHGTKAEAKKESDRRRREHGKQMLHKERERFPDA